jgi:ankyrin repeat protein
MTSILALLKALINNAKALLNKDVNAKDECGRTALMRAAHHGSSGNVKTLLDMGADVNTSDPWDVTALIMATAQGRDDIVLLLREAGAKE